MPSSIIPCISYLICKSPNLITMLAASAVQIGPFQLETFGVNHPLMHIQILRRSQTSPLEKKSTCSPGQLANRCRTSDQSGDQGNANIPNQTAGVGNKSLSGSLTAGDQQCLFQNIEVGMVPTLGHSRLHPVPLSFAVCRIAG